jgi:hypothetical protein
MKKTGGRKSRETVSLSGTCLTFKLYNKIIKRPLKSHETIPLRQRSKVYEINSKCFD